MSIQPLAPELLRPPCPPAGLNFESTAELEDLKGSFGHARALEALRVGLGIRREGYNIFVVGDSGVGKNTVVLDILRERAARESIPSDWCYVANFEESHKPRAFKLPPGEGAKLKTSMNTFIEDLRTVLPVIFTSDSYTSRVHAINEAMNKLHDQALETVKESAVARGLALVKTEEGLTFLPALEGEPIEPAAFEELPEDVKSEYEAKLEETENELQAVFGGVPRWRKETRDKLQALEREVVDAEVARLLEPLRKTYESYPEVLEFFSAVERDIPEQVHLFREDPVPEEEEEGGDSEVVARARKAAQKVEIRRYQVNVLVDHGKAQGAPVIYEDMPAFANLIGRIEHMTEFGALLTDHTLIKAGAFHLASGGYLVLDAWRLVQSPYAWQALKRVLRSRLVRMDPPEQAANPMTTVMLTPDPIPVDVKVVVMGPAELYYELCDQDPEVERHFKILAAFEERFPWTIEATQLFARLIATKAREKKLLPFSKGAVGRVIEEAARAAEDHEYLSANLARLFNLLDEAEFWALEAGSAQVELGHVDAALEAYERRHSAPRDEWLNSLQRGTILVSTEGLAVGQLNGLAVVSLGSYAFGRVSKISATARVGSGEVIDIERESELSGSLHSKGILILQSLLGSRYATDMPLSLAASLTFEQSYSVVDGDSASMGEYCALLSAISQIPLRQSLAVTGSINQKGEVQAIGGVNEKIEGFFDICERRGFAGDSPCGVIIPKANVQSLMLQPRVVEAVKAGKFNIWAVATVEEALSLLTGHDIGQLGPDGHYPADSLNGRVQARLRYFHEVSQGHKHS